MLFKLIQNSSIDSAAIAKFNLLVAILRPYERLGFRLCHLPQLQFAFSDIVVLDNKRDVIQVMVIGLSGVQFGL